MPDSSVFRGLNGTFRLFTLILGAIDVGITSDSFYHNVRTEIFFLVVVTILFIKSIILAAIAFFGIHGSIVWVKRGDYVYHVVGGIVLLVAGMAMTICVIHYGRNRSTIHFIERIAAVVIAILNAIVYIVLGANSFRTEESKTGR